MDDRFIINVASGKGGTGKTLLCALLAEMLGNRGIPTLLIDLDFFVRGLTALLYFHQQEAIYLTNKNQITVSDLFVKKNNKNISSKLKNLGIVRYHSFDVLPSVSRVDELLNYKDIMPDDRDEAATILKKLFSILPDRYKVILIDCRAGYDELISAIHICSDITICVEEEDDIAKVTADNLIKQLQIDSETPLFRLINKARNIENEEDLKEAKRSINEIGPIPFDIDVMNTFGKPTFWHDISKSLYRVAVIKAWNRLCIKMKLNYELPETRFSPLAFSSIEKLLTLFSINQRLFLVYGVILTTIGFVLAFSGGEFINFIAKDPVRIIGLITGVVGFITIVGVLLRSKRR